MRTKELKEKFPDLTMSNITFDVVYSRRDVEEKLRSIYGNNIVRYESSGRKATIATSRIYGRFINQLKPGTKVVMTGGEVQINPELATRVWTVTTDPTFIGGWAVVWLEGFSGAYSCEMLRLSVECELQP